MDTLLYIGRFQPFHLGHLQVLNFALDNSEMVVVGLGSCQDLSYSNPFSAERRKAMIRGSIKGKTWRTEFIELQDFPKQDDLWVQQVRDKMKRYGPFRIVGVNKDASSFYLGLFPDIEVIIPPGPFLPLSATDIRGILFDQKPCKLERIRSMVPAGTLEQLEPLFGEN